MNSINMQQYILVDYFNLHNINSLLCIHFPLIHNAYFRYLHNKHNQLNRIFQMLDKHMFQYIHLRNLILKHMLDNYLYIILESMQLCNMDSFQHTILILHLSNNVQSQKNRKTMKIHNVYLDHIYIRYHHSQIHMIPINFPMSSF